MHELTENDIQSENFYHFNKKGFLFRIHHRLRFITTSASQLNKKKKRQDGNRELMTTIITVSTDESHLPATLIYKE